jgi:hypothetical protein
MEQQQAEASFFILGSALHTAIENAIVFDMDEDWALGGLNATLNREIERVVDAINKNDVRVIESSKRGFDTMIEDAERMLRNWFKFVHPDSDKRLPIYDGYDWPPRTEVAFMSPAVRAGTAFPVWGSIDAIFYGKEGVAHVDWKSGASRQRNSDQLHFYAFGMQEGNAEGFATWFHHLDKVQARSIIQHADPYPGDDAVRARILATEAIKGAICAGEYPQFNADWYCNYCPVQHYCPVEGDVRNRDANAQNLRSMLRLARPMTELPEREVA